MNLKYRPDIDGLRAIAVLAVIIYHAEFRIGDRAVLPGGFFGVDIFFVISGFLITSLILKERRETGAFSVLHFYQRRARRLLPALLVVVVASVPLAWHLLLPTQLIDYSGSIIASLLFVSNFYWDASLQQYGGDAALLRPFVHTWSLAVEEQYYILYPWLLLGIYRFFTKAAIGVLTTALLASFVLAVFETPRDPSYSFFMLPTRLWELLFGGVLAIVAAERENHSQPSLVSRVLPNLGLVFIILSVAFIPLGSSHPGFLTLAPLIGAVFIIGFSNRSNSVTKMLSSRPVVWVGLISYSLYLWHYPIFAFGRIANPQATATDKLLWIFLTFALAYLSYYLIEKPFRSKAKISWRVTVLTLFGSMLVLSAFAFYTIRSDGLKERFPELVKLYDKNEFDNMVLRTRSWSILQSLAGYDRPIDTFNFVDFMKKLAEFERQHQSFPGDPDKKRNVLIVGNSHGKDLFNALYLNQSLFDGLAFARFGLRVDIPDKQLDDLMAAPIFVAADVIVVSYKYLPITIDRLPLLFDRVRKTGKLLIVTSNTVEFNAIDGMPIFDWYMQQKFLGTELSDGELKTLFYVNRNQEIIEKVNPAVLMLAHQFGVEFLDKSKFICDDDKQTCDGITLDGFKAFFDYGHWTLEGSKYFGERIHELNWLTFGQDG